LQLSHTLLQLLDKETGQPFENPQMRLAVFVTKLRSALPQVFGWVPSRSLQGGTAALPEKKKEFKEGTLEYANYKDLTPNTLVVCAIFSMTSFNIM
jgi:hypothetical protein